MSLRLDQLKVIIGNESASIDLTRHLDISIPLRDGAKNPNCYFSDPPSITPVKSGDFIGSVAKGGPCNHNVVRITPHGNGTHTECFGHISPNENITLNSCLKRYHFGAQVVSVPLQLSEHGDQLITWANLKPLLQNPVAEALIIRSLPNSSKKLTASYSGCNPAYLEEGVTKRLRELEVNHLLVDLPSVDKENDGGQLQSHRDFWNYPANPRTECTITELVYIPDLIADGHYLLNLQIISLESDASPSKPVLYPIIPDEGRGVEIG